MTPTKKNLAAIGFYYPSRAVVRHQVFVEFATFMALGILFALSITLN